MHRFIVLLALILASSYSNGQEHRFSMGLMGSNYWGFLNHHRPDDAERITQQLRYNASGGVRFQYDFGKRMFVRSDVQWSRFSYTRPNDRYFYKPDNVVKDIQLHTTLSTPLLLGARFNLNEKWKLSVAGGLGVDWHLWYKTFNVMESGEVVEVEVLSQPRQLRPDAYFLQIGTGIEFHPTDRLFFSIEPTFRWDPSQSVQGSPVSGFRIGSSFTVNFRF